MFSQARQSATDDSPLAGLLYGASDGVLDTK